MSKFLLLNRMSYDRALELAEQTCPYIDGFAINDLVLHYGCEIVYALKSMNKKILVDLPLSGPAKNITNNLYVLSSAGADLISISHHSHYQPPPKFVDKCVLSITDLANIEVIIESGNYKYVICKRQQLGYFKTSTKIIVVSNEEDNESEIIVRDWWTFVAKLNEKT